MTERTQETPNPIALKLSQPVSVWNKSISFEPRKFLQGIGKAVIKGVALDVGGVGEAALESVDAAGLREKPEELAWLLISRSLTAALAELVKNYVDLFRNPPQEDELETLSARFEEEMGKAEVSISLDFFKQPGELPLLKQLQDPLSAWLQGLGAQQTDAEQIACRLPDYFVFALHETWRKAPQDYAALTQHFATPFTKATEEMRSWRLYNQWLHRQISDRMFEEAFGVEKVYVPLRAYYEEKERDEEPKNAARSLRRSGTRPNGLWWIWKRSSALGCATSRTARLCASSAAGRVRESPPLPRYSPPRLPQKRTSPVCTFPCTSLMPRIT